MDRLAALGLLVFWVGLFTLVGIVVWSVWEIWERVAWAMVSAGLLLAAGLGLLATAAWIETVRHERWARNQEATKED